MKLKKLLILISMIMVLALAVACSSDAEAETQTETTETETDAVIDVSELDEAVDTADGTAPNRQGIESTNLMMAVFQLESTEYAITTEQAEQLLPLWKVYQSLLDSSTAAEAEREALLTQIAGVFTDEQMAYVDSGEMDLEETNALMAELGIEFGMGGGMGGERPEGEDGEFEGAPGGGDMPADMQAMGAGQGNGDGSGQGGGMAGMGGAEIDADQMATMQAERAENGGGARGGAMDETLLPVLIEFLETKTEA